MRILFLTQYFPPEVGAPQNRLFEIAVRLKRKGMAVSVLTAMPNYPKMEVASEYKGKIYNYETMEGLAVYRSYIFVSKSKSIIFRLFNYFSFVLSSLIVGFFKIKKQDFILCESPPLFLGITAVLISKLKGSKLIFNVSDLWPESAEKLGLIKNKFLLNLTTRLEEYLYKNSNLITGQTQGIVNNISLRFPSKDVYWLKNGVDINYFRTEQIIAGWKERNGFIASDFILLYAGILGYAQSLEIILYAANILRNHEHLKFAIIGSGPEREKLFVLKEELNLKNVYFFETVSKSEMPEIVKDIDASIIPLKKIELFKGAIPSKIFEILALSKPILLGVDGEAKELFVEEAKAGLFFEPENYKDLAEKINFLASNPETLLTLGRNGRKYVELKFNRDTIAEEFFNKLNMV